MKIKILPIAIFVIFFIIFLIFYKGLQNPNIYIPKTNLKNELPSFNAKIFDTNDQISDDVIFENDKFYLVNIWASWCNPCREEHFFLLDIKREKNIKIVGINYKDNNENAKRFLKELGNPYDIILLDKNGTLAIEWGAYGVPETFLVYNKKIIKKIIGPINKDLLKEIEKLIQ